MKKGFVIYNLLCEQDNSNVYNSFVASKPPKFCGSPNISLTKYQLSVFFMFTFCWENKFLIGQSTKNFSVKTGFEELKKKVNKISLKKIFVDHEILVVWMPRMS